MDWPELAERQAGVVGRDQLRRHGLSDAAITRMLSNGALVKRRHGVFLVRGAPLTYEARLWIAVVSTGGVLGFATAAHLWDMDARPPLIHVIVGRERRVMRDAGLRRHHVSVPTSMRTTIDDLPVTARPWTLMDHIGRLRLNDAIRLADRGLQRGWLTQQDIARRIVQYPGRQGNAILRRLLDIAADDAAAQSERILHQLLRSAGLTGWCANYPIRAAGVVVARLDVAFPEKRLAIEVDGMAFHVDPDRFVGDRRRQNDVVGLGWTVLRFTWWDLVERPDHVIDTIRAQLRRAS